MFTPQSSGAQVTTLIISPYLARERTLPVLRFGLAGVPGTAPGLGRMIVQDDSGNDQYWTRWGQQHDRLSRMASTTDFFYEAEALTPLNGSTVVTGFAGASGGHVMRQSGSTSTPAAMLSTQILSSSQLGHLGDFEVWARVYYDTSDTGTVASLQLQWSIGDLLSWTSNPAVSPAQQGAYCLVNLGTIHVPAVTAGAQQWQGRILASTSLVGPDAKTIDVDCLFFVPLNDGGATVDGVNSRPPLASSFTGQDAFDQASATFNGATLPIGGTWATTNGGGAATDFTVDTSGHHLDRTATDTGNFYTQGRFAAASSTTLAGVAAALDIALTTSASPICVNGLVLRFPSASNYALIALDARANGTATIPATIDLAVVISGVSTVLASVAVPSLLQGASNTLIGTIDTQGRMIAYWGPAGTRSVCEDRERPKLAACDRRNARVREVRDLQPQLEHRRLGRVRQLLVRAVHE